MEKEEKMNPAINEKKRGPGSNPENKFKKGKPATAAELNNIITSAVEKVKPNTSEGFANKGTVPGYEQES